jgi:hypothetical protein
MGESVGLLFMIENYNIKTIRWPMPLHLTVVNKGLNCWYHVQNLFSKANDAKFAFFKSKVYSEWGRLKISLLVKMSTLSRKCGFSFDLKFPHVRVDEAYDTALAEYTPAKYHGKIVLFGARKRLAGFNDKDYGWECVACQGVETCELPINPRGSLVEPYVRLLANQLGEHLRRARVGTDNCQDSADNSSCCACAVAPTNSPS